MRTWISQLSGPPSYALCGLREKDLVQMLMDMEGKYAVLQIGGLREILPGEIGVIAMPPAERKDTELV